MTEKSKLTARMDVNSYASCTNYAEISQDSKKSHSSLLCLKQTPSQIDCWCMSGDLSLRTNFPSVLLNFLFYRDVNIARHI
jgi:predicted transcriptional regulator YheO